MTPNAQHIALGTHRLRVAVGGEGSPEFLCLHGLVDTIEIWDRLGGPLEARGRVIRVDQRGHGASEAPPGPYSREDLAGDVASVIEQLATGPVVLVGHSMGGIISMATALAFPDRVAGLVLIGTASQCNEKTASWYERIAQAGERDGNPGLARAIYGKDSPKEIQGDPQGIAAVTRMLKSLHEAPLTPRLRDIGCPALLIVGDRDPMGPKASSIMADSFREATLVTVQDCGHWVHVAAPERCIEAIDAFVQPLGSHRQGVSDE